MGEERGRKLDAVASECVDTGTGGVRFEIVRELGDFEGARQVCLEQTNGDGDLASIHSDEEFEVARQLVQKYSFIRLGAPDAGAAVSGDEEFRRLEEYDGNETLIEFVGTFIGLRDVSFDSVNETSQTERFAWVDGSAFDYGTVGRQLPWASDEPNNARDLQEDCVEFDRTRESVWNDNVCDKEGFALCRSLCEIALPNGSGTGSPTIAPSAALPDVTMRETENDGILDDILIIVLPGVFGLVFFGLLVGFLLTRGPKKGTTRSNPFHINSQLFQSKSTLLSAQQHDINDMSTSFNSKRGRHFVGGSRSFSSISQIFNFFHIQFKDRKRNNPDSQFSAPSRDDSVRSIPFLPKREGQYISHIKQNPRTFAADVPDLDSFREEIIDQGDAGISPLVQSKNEPEDFSLLERADSARSIPYIPRRQLHYGISNKQRPVLDDDDDLSEVQEQSAIATNMTARSKGEKKLNDVGEEVTTEKPNIPDAITSVPPDSSGNYLNHPFLPKRVEQYAPHAFQPHQPQVPSLDTDIQDQANNLIIRNPQTPKDIPALPRKVVQYARRPFENVTAVPDLDIDPEENKQDRNNDEVSSDDDNRLMRTRSVPFQPRKAGLGYGMLRKPRQFDSSNFEDDIP